jgi:hypothetical protein
MKAACATPQVATHIEAGGSVRSIMVLTRLSVAYGFVTKQRRIPTSSLTKGDRH